MSFAIEIPIAKVEIKHFEDMVATLAHRFSQKAFSILTSQDNVIFTEVDRNQWEFSLDAYGNIVLECRPYYHQIHQDPTGSKTSNGGVTSPTTKDIKQLFDYLINGKYRP